MILPQKESNISKADGFSVIYNNGITAQEREVRKERLELP